MIPKQDRIRPRTPEDLERMYKFGKRNEEMRGLATKTEVDEVGSKIPTKVGQLENDKGYINDLTGYAKETYVDGKVSGLATETFVKTSIAQAQLEDQEVDLSTFATKDELAEVEGAIPDTSGLATKQEVTDVENKIPDVSGLATKQEVANVENKIPDTSGLATKQEVANVAQQIPDTSNLATKDEVKNVENKIPDTSGLATKQEVTTATKDLATKAEVAAVESKIPDVSNLATESYVDGKVSGLATETFVKNEIAQAQLGGDDTEIDLSGYATKDDLEAVEEKIPNVSGLAQKSELQEYAKKTDIPDVSEFLKEDDLGDYVTETELGNKGYATKTDVTTATKDLATKDEVTTATKDLATKQEVQDVEDKVDAIEIPDLSPFLTKEQIQQLINQAISNLATKQDVTTATKDLATKTEVTQQIDSATSDLATKEEVAAVKNKIPTATSQLINNSGYVTESTVKDLIDEAMGESGSGSGDTGGGNTGGSGGTGDAIEEGATYESTEPFETKDAAEGTTIACAVTSLYEYAEGELWSPLHISTYHKIQSVTLFLDQTLSGTYTMSVRDSEGNVLDESGCSSDVFSWTFTPNEQEAYTDIYIYVEFVNDNDGVTYSAVPFERIRVVA